jgi:hypothetical protein
MICDVESTYPLYPSGGSYWSQGPWCRAQSPAHNSSSHIVFENPHIGSNPQLPGLQFIPQQRDYLTALPQQPNSSFTSRLGSHPEAAFQSFPPPSRHNSTLVLRSQHNPHSIRAPPQLKGLSEVGRAELEQDPAFRALVSQGQRDNERRRRDREKRSLWRKNGGVEKSWQDRKKH